MKSRLQLLLSALIVILFTSGATAANVITVKPPRKGDATATLQRAIDKAARLKGPVEIRLAPGRYDISSEKSTVRPYRISNTASEDEHPTADKHIGLLFKGLSDITLCSDGTATLVTHGEMTPWVIDSCTNITFRGLTIDAYDPSVTEMRVTAMTDSTITARVHRDSRYAIRDGKLYWQGCGWEFTDGIAQIFSPVKRTSLRTSSPTADASSVEEIEPGLLLFRFAGRRPADCEVGCVYQSRHSIRSEAAGLINGSSGISLIDCHFAFLGNFGIVSQMSDNIAIRKCDFAPLENSERTNAGFADFLQFSSCGGHIDIAGCNFIGSHDDPINIHGTHQKVTAAEANTVTVRYMHPQTFGFTGFAPGDSIAFTDPATLLYKGRAIVSRVRMTDPYSTELTLDSMEVNNGDQPLTDLIVENLTRCPSVNINECYFTMTPTRGILISTRGHAVISNCLFDRCPMASILVADDGRSWYESGPVTDLTIKDNAFVSCANPVISIAPEAIAAEGYVHSGITIESNGFVMEELPQIRAYSVDGLTVKGNAAFTPKRQRTSVTVDTNHCRATINQ